MSITDIVAIPADMGFRDYLNLQVTSSKEILRAAHGLSINEKRLIAMCIAQIDPNSKITPTEIAAKSFRVYATDFQKTFDVSPGNSYTGLKSAHLNLFDRYIAFKYIVDGKTKVERARWISEIAYADEMGYIELKFSHKIASHLTLPLIKEFGAFKIKSVAGLRSVYSWRLFELITEFRLTGWCIPDMEDIRHALEVPETYSWFDIKRRILEPAIKELNKQIPSLDLKYEPKKQGRNVAKVKFTFSKSDRKKIPDHKKNIKPKRKS